AGSTQEVACGDVLDAHAVGLEDLDPVAAQAIRPEVLVAGGGRALRRARLGAVDDDAVAVETTEVNVRRRDEDAGAGLVGWLVGRVVASLVVIAGCDQDPIAGARGVHGRLNRAERGSGGPRRMALGHAQDAGRSGHGKGKRDGEDECEGKQTGGSTELACARERPGLLHLASLPAGISITTASTGDMCFNPAQGGPGRTE